MKKIIFHIGFHKTATTTLQNKSFVGLDNWFYVKRTSSSFNNEIYNSIVDYCFLGGSSLFDVIGKINSVEGKILVSEEWFLSDYDSFSRGKSVSWQKKLKRLSDILRSFDSTIVVSLRHPCEGVFSQYCEFLQVYDVGEYQSQYLISNDAKAYDYHYLDGFLGELFDDVVYVPFSKSNIQGYQEEWSNILGEKVIIENNLNSKKELSFGVLIDKPGFVARAARKFKVPIMFRTMVRKVFPRYLEKKFFYKKHVVRRDKECVGFEESIKFYNKLNR